MNLKKWMVPAIMVMVSGCASVAIKPALLQIAIEPQQLTPGTVVTVTVTSPVAMKTVQGRLDLPGAPLISLTPLDSKTWIWRTQIPLEVSWKPGRYHITVEGLSTAGAALFGETWVRSP